MSKTLCRIIFALPVIVLKTIVRFILVTIYTFPITGFAIIPGIMYKNIFLLIIGAIVPFFGALWADICKWRRSYFYGDLGTLSGW